MLADNFDRSLRAFARRTPFRPFTVELVSGALIQVDHPEALVIRGGIAVFVDSTGVPTILDHEGVSRLNGASDQAASA